MLISLYTIAFYSFLHLPFRLLGEKNHFYPQGYVSVRSANVISLQSLLVRKYFYFALNLESRFSLGWFLGSWQLFSFKSLKQLFHYFPESTVTEGWSSISLFFLYRQSVFIMNALRFLFLVFHVFHLYHNVSQLVNIFILCSDCIWFFMIYVLSFGKFSRPNSINISP